MASTATAIIPHQAALRPDLTEPNSNPRPRSENDTSSKSDTSCKAQRCTPRDTLLQPFPCSQTTITNVTTTSAEGDLPHELHISLPTSNTIPLSSPSLPLTPVATTPNVPPHRIKTHPLPNPASVLDVLDRHYPKPTAELDIAEALAREPPLGRWAYGGKPYAGERKETEEERRKEFEQAKRDLRGLGR